jgi:hypothetical protein
MESYSPTTAHTLSVSLAKRDAGAHFVCPTHHPLLLGFPLADSSTARAQSVRPASMEAWVFHTFAVHRAGPLPAESSTSRLKSAVQTLGHPAKKTPCVRDSDSCPMRRKQYVLPCHAGRELCGIDACEHSTVQTQQSKQYVLRHLFPG